MRDDIADEIEVIQTGHEEEVKSLKCDYEKTLDHAYNNLKQATDKEIAAMKSKRDEWKKKGILVENLKGLSISEITCNGTLTSEYSFCKCSFLVIGRMMIENDEKLKCHSCLNVNSSCQYSSHVVTHLGSLIQAAIVLNQQSKDGTFVS